MDSDEEVSHGNHPPRVTNAEDDVAHHAISECPVAGNGHAEVAPTDNSIGDPYTTHHGH